MKSEAHRHRSKSGHGEARRRRTEVDLEPIWRGLSNRVRRAILDLLRTGPRATGELAAEFPELSRFAVMQHLRVLEEGGLVVRRKRGRVRMNYLNPVPIQEIYHRWVSRYDRPWMEALVSLRDDLEGRGRETPVDNDKESSNGG